MGLISLWIGLEWRLIYQNLICEICMKFIILSFLSWAISSGKTTRVYNYRLNLTIFSYFNRYLEYRILSEVFRIARLRLEVTSCMAMVSVTQHHRTISTVYCLNLSKYSPRRQSFVSEIWNLYKRAETKLAKCGPQTCPVLAWQHQGPPTDALSGHLTFSIRIESQEPGLRIV